MPSNQAEGKAMPQTAEISRVTRSRREAQATYDRLSGWYDWLEGVWETKARNLALARLGVKPGETVLEIGIGPGHGR